MTVHLNHVPNPSAEGATASLENNSGASVSIVTTTASDWPADGSSSYSVVASGTSSASARLRAVDRAPTAAGQRWHLRAKVRAFAGNTGSRSFSAQGVTYDVAPGATIGTATAVTTDTFTLAPGEIRDVALSFVAPVGALSAGFSVVRNAGSGAAAGDGFHVDMLALVQDDDPDAPVLYFDPDANGLAVWNGTADASTSTLYIPDVVLELLEVGDAYSSPQPGVKVTVSDLPSWADNVTVSVTAPDEPLRIVRGARAADALATFVVDDFEAALGVVSDYSVEVRDDVVRLGVTDPVSITVPAGDPLEVWIADPLDPSMVVRGTIADSFAETMGKDRDGDFATPGGSVDGSVLLAGANAGYTGIPLDFYTETDADTQQFRRLRDQTPIAVIRTSPPVPVPRTLYVALLNPRSRLLIKESGFTRWAWSSRQVQSPKIGVVVPLHTYEDYMAFYATYSAAMAVFTDYVDAVRNPPPSV